MGELMDLLLLSLFGIPSPSYKHQDGKDSSCYKYNDQYSAHYHTYHHPNWWTSPCVCVCVHSVCVCVCVCVCRVLFYALCYPNLLRHI